MFSNQTVQPQVGTAVARPGSAVHCSGVTKDFGDGAQVLRVLHGIEAAFAYGELSLLVGPSGCGKTTLISIIAGLLTASSGAVQVLGSDLTHMRPRDLTNFRLRNIGFIFQQYHLLPALTAAENASVALAAAGWSRKKALTQAKELLCRLGLSADVDKLPRQLSGGQQQRVAIARALANNPRLVLCDEPTAALDAASGHEVMALLRETAVGPDRACIVVSHDNRVFELADRIVAMEDGRIDNKIDGRIGDHHAQGSTAQPLRTTT